MILYYTLVQSKSHAFLLESRFRQEGIQCELTNVPRNIVTDLCSLGIRFTDADPDAALDVVRRCRLPGCKVFREVRNGGGILYEEVYSE
jgi:hypothetical protein